MRVVVAPDSYAGTLTAVAAAEALSAGWLRSASRDDVVRVPMSDGGPGFLDVLSAALPAARLVPVTVGDPHGRPVPAAVLVDEATGTAYVETAQACGLHLLTPAERDPTLTTTAGVGTLLAAARDSGARRVVAGLGGSATHDGGRGAVEALAAGAGGAAWPADLPLVIATDVDVPLADAAWFAPQKGASPAQLPELAARLVAWADEVEARVGMPRLRMRDGAGAAGGLGFGLLSLGAVRESGVGVVAAAVGLAGALAGSDLAVTGEGRYDATSLRGKVAAGVARLAMAEGLACVVLAGELDVGLREARSHGIEEMRSAAELAGSVEASLAAPAYWLEELAARTAQRWSRA